MDGLDVRLLRVLVQDPLFTPLAPDFRRSFRAIAKRVRADEGTVRYRIRRFHETGFIREWGLIVNPLLVGCGDAGVWLDVSASVPMAQLVKELGLMRGVYLVMTYHGGFLTCAFRHDGQNTLMRQVELIRTLAKAEDLGVGTIPFPDCPIHLSPSDWSVLKLIHHNPRRTYSSIAREVGLSSRTVKRKVRRIIQGNAVFAFPALNPASLRGSVMALIVATCSPDRKVEVDRSVATTFEDYVWYTLPLVPLRPDEPMPCIYNLMLPNLTAGGEILDAVREIPGVRAARLELAEQVHTMFEPFEEALLKGQKHPSPAAGRRTGPSTQS